LTPVPNSLRHFSIECDDVERARVFYQGVFGWLIEPWGPPGFFQVFTEPTNRAITGDLREREGPPGPGVRGFVCTFGVADLDATTARVLAHGGQVAVKRFRIEGVGDLAYFIDTEGNRFGAMKYAND
jgi:predicted enzyme related to lactoylglutathione lyase